MRQIVLKPLGRGEIHVFGCGSTYHSVWWDPLFVRERERHTHTQRKLGTPEIHPNAPIAEVCIMSAPIYFMCASPVGTVTAYTGLYLSIKLFTSQTINTNHKYWSRHTWRRFKGCHRCVCWEWEVVSSYLMFWHNWFSRFNVNSLLAIVKISLLWTSPVHSLGLFGHLMDFTSHGQSFILALPTKARILCLDSFITEYSSLRDFGP
jgi:hypothetical protein